MLQTTITCSDGRCRGPFGYESIQEIIRYQGITDALLYD
jgi:hypothetical protein